MHGTAKSATAAQHMGQAAQKIGLSLALLGVFAYLLRDRILALDLGAATATMQTFAPAQWAMALAATAISFWAIGRYDAVVHRHLATTVAGPEARRAGIAAIAISQTVGAGVFTGALVRWRMLRCVSLWQATRISLAVTLSFLGGWAFFTGAVLSFTPHAPLPLLGQAVLAAGLTLLALGLWQPHALRRLHLPNAQTQTRLIIFTALDTAAACAALYVLLPPEAGLTPATLLPAFLLALGAGLISGTPGGVGPFEVTLLALLPHVPQAPLLAAILGWRMVYFALPAVLGALLAALGPSSHARGPDAALRPVPPARLAAQLMQSTRAEAGLIHQGHLALMQSRLGGSWITGRTAHALIGLLDPIGTQQPQRATLHALAHQARAEARCAAIYRCTARTAALARQLGWQVRALGHEAVISPTTFTLQGSACATLRRKLRRAESAGVTLQIADPRGAAERAAIARLWARARKGEHGFSMGRYAEGYLSGQLVVEARLQGRLVAFASFHQGPQEWTLDLMRHHPDAPDGTMQAIITHAIALARAAHLPRLSLAAAGLLPNLPRALRRLSGAQDTGLRHFKQMFAPRWQPLYLAAPTRTALLVAAAEVTRAVHHPAPLRTRPPHHHLADYEIAPKAQTWHRSA